MALPFLSLPGFAQEEAWGIILNTVKHDMEADWRGTLTTLAEMGYRYIEGNSYGDDPKAYAQFARGLGLIPIGGGSSMGWFEDNWEQQLRTADALGHECVICYWPWLSSAENLTREECLQTAEQLNALGKQAKQAGLRLSWHNHDKEFRAIGDTNAFELLMQHTDPDWVNMQMDLYWVVKGGADPVACIRQFPGRIDLFHVKDMDATEEQGITCVGAGVIDFAEIFALKEEAGIRYATVEHERTEAGEGIPCATVSMAHLKQL